ncbi:zinc finger CCCH domain-containing protein 14 isoform X2 [Maniola hyperantus]|uniref:zinc finger CCCH domain-containing protein 14 isoform X2 n=1 Tax=Aphantopus hyperantus TaxID=2795564 RepID=UPI001569330E|nr:zinc finger CCCH domain-containing protein 14 [Maniola hyperantus]
MDVVGSEIGQKMRSAIKAKLTELGCYVDDELPDYVMVMVANKRTRAQMEDDLQLFLGDNTELFVNWLHQVLKKLQEVTVTTPIKADVEKPKERSVSKDRKVKEKKDKDKSKKSDSAKKAKKKEKEKDKARKKVEKKSHKSKKKSKHHEMIRPNVPPLLMNMEKESEPSITDVFAGQILKNHGVLLESYKEDPKQVETKAVFEELKRPIIPIIDPATISQPETSENNRNTIENIDKNTENINENTENIIKTTQTEVRDEQIKEINQIEAKIQGLKQKLAEQLDSMSDDEDFLTIRTEAEELMNDFAEDVMQEISQPPPITPPLQPQKSPTPPPKILDPIQKPTEISKEPETLPQIELNLPKRPIRERLGAREMPKVQELKEKETTKKPESPERFTPEKEIEFRPQRSARSRLGTQSETQRRISMTEDSSDKCESSSKRLTSKVSVLENRSGRSTCASVVRVRPRPRVSAPASSLLMRAVADAHKSLLNIPPKVDPEPQKIKRALVLPMRRCMEAQKIVIQVPGGADTHSDSQGDTISLGDMDSEGDDKSSKVASDIGEKIDFAPQNITKVIKNTDYVPGSGSSRQDDMIVDSITIHNTTVGKDKNTQFIVTMDGYHPNAFLAKKLMTEGLLDEGDMKDEPKEPAKTKQKEKEIIIDTKETEEEKIAVEKPEEVKETVIPSAPKKRLSNTSEESDTQVIINKDEEKIVEKRKSTDVIEPPKEVNVEEEQKESPPAKKRKASPIVFDVGKKEKEETLSKREKETVRERTVSASSDSHVTLSTTASSHKYDAIPPLSLAERKLVWCRAFPLCRFGSACAFAHPRCKFAAACTRRGCVYSHSPNALPGPASPAPVVASHVVPAANYKSISAVTLPSMCKFYPGCVNPACHYYHPKPCRYGKACANKLECNFYHHDVAHKWKYSV